MSAAHRGRLAAPILVVILAAAASPQAPRNDAAMRAAWKPVVGSGAAYVVEHKDLGRMEMEIAVVGTENVGGKTGYWVEEFFKDPRHGEGKSKTLFVGDRNSLQIKRMFTQAPDGPLIELPMEMFEGGEEEEESELILLGTETITTPAGTFLCQQYRTKEKKTSSEDMAGAGRAEDDHDFWLSEKVTPFGIVKMTSKDSTQTLVRLITNAQPRIKGTPQKLDPKETKRPRPQP